MAITITPTGDLGTFQSGDIVNIPFQASGGTAPYSAWTVITGELYNLQMVTNADGSGTLAGRINAAGGSYTLTIQVQDSTFTFGTGNVTLNVLAPFSQTTQVKIPPSFNDDCLPEGRQIMSTQINWTAIYPFYDAGINPPPVWTGVLGADQNPYPQTGKVLWMSFDIDPNTFNVQLSALQGIIISVLGATSSQTFVFDFGDGMPLVLANLGAYYIQLPLFVPPTRKIRVYLIDSNGLGRFSPLQTLSFKVGLTNFKLRPIMSLQQILIPS